MKNLGGFQRGRLEASCVAPFFCGRFQSKGSWEQGWQVTTREQLNIKSLFVSFSSHDPVCPKSHMFVQTCGVFKFHFQSEYVWSSPHHRALWVRRASRGHPVQPCSPLGVCLLLPQTHERWDWIFLKRMFIEKMPVKGVGRKNQIYHSPKWLRKPWFNCKEISKYSD